MAISDQLSHLNELRINLAENIAEKGVTTASTEGLETLVPKVLEISTMPADALRLQTMEITTLGTFTLPVAPEYVVLTWYMKTSRGDTEYIDAIFTNDGTDRNVVWANIRSTSNRATNLGTGSLAGNVLTLPKSTSYITSTYPATLYMFYR